MNSWFRTRAQIPGSGGDLEPSTGESHQLVDAIVVQIDYPRISDALLSYSESCGDVREGRDRPVVPVEMQRRLSAHEEILVTVAIVVDGLGAHVGVFTRSIQNIQSELGSIAKRVSGSRTAVQTQLVGPFVAWIVGRAGGSEPTLIP